MRLCLEAVRKLSFWSEFLGQMRTLNQAPETLLKLLVQMPSLLRAHLLIVIMLRLPTAICDPFKEPKPCQARGVDVKV